MPFDALSTAKTTTILDRAMINGVPQKTLDDYKKAQLKKVLRDTPTTLRHQVQWFEYDKRETDNVLLAVANRVGYNAPRAVRDIVTKAENALRLEGAEVERVAGWLYTDPYVCVRYRTRSEEGTVCLAIWEEGTVHHIATIGEPPPLPAEATKWVKRLLGK